MKKLLFIFLISIFLFFFNTRKLNSFSDNSNALSFRDSIDVIDFSFVGDLMCHSIQYKYSQTDSGYDFTNNYQFIKPFLNKRDFMVGNIETVFAGKQKGYSGYPAFNTPDEYLLALKDAGFDMLLTANNHSLDKGMKGLIRTIDKIDEVGIYHTGTFKSQEERDSIKVLEVNGIQFSLLAYSYGTNGIPVPKDKNFLINLIDTTLIKNDIQKAKQSNADLVITYFHFGNEYQTEPSSWQKNIVKETIKYGADIIIGSHPHVPQPIEFFKTNNANLDSGFVAYSLGNFISNQRWRYSDGGPILNFQIVKDKLLDSIYVNDINVVPTWVFKGEVNGDNQFIILPSDSVISKIQYPFLTDTDRKLYEQSYRDILGIMSTHTNKIKFYSPVNELKKFLAEFPFFVNQ